MTPAASDGGGQLRGRGLGGVRQHRQVRPVLGGEGVVEGRVRRHQQPDAQDARGDGGGGGQRDHDGLHPAAAHPGADDPAQRAHRSGASSASTRGVGGDPAVDDLDRAGGALGREGPVVRDQQHRLPVGVQVGEQPAYVGTGRGVQRSGRLVGQQQRRPVHQRPGHGHPLPLAARQPTRVGAGVAVDAQRPEQLGGPSGRLPATHAGQLGREDDVLEHGEVVQQVEELEDQPDRGAPVPRRGRLAQGVDATAADGDGARGRPVEAGDQVQQRGLPAAGRPEDGDGLAGGHGQRDVVQGGRAVVVPAGHAVQLDEWFGHGRNARSAGGWGASPAMRLSGPPSGACSRPSSSRRSPLRPLSSPRRTRWVPAERRMGR